MTQSSLLNLESFSHGTVECTDMAATRRFLTEFLGLDIVRPLPEAQYMWKGGPWSIVCVCVDGDPKEQSIQNRFKLSVSSPEAVTRAYEAALAGKDEYQIRQILDLEDTNGVRSFILKDMNNSWWEVTSTQLSDYDAIFAKGDATQH